MANLTPPGRVALPGHVHHSTVASFENETAQMPQKIKMLNPSLSTGDSNASPDSTSFPRLWTSPLSTDDEALKRLGY